MSDLISREEVLNLIDTAFENGAFDGRYAYENLIDAIQNLIHPLETDLVSRQAVLDIAKSSKSNWIDNSVLFIRVSELPSVNPERKLEKCSDCISRKAATDRFDLVQSDDKCMGYDDIMAFLMSLPSVDPWQNTGYWMLKKTFPTKLYDEYLNEYKCSECYRRIRCTESQLVNYPYCHCGCHMIEPQESEEV